MNANQKYRLNSYLTPDFKFSSPCYFSLQVPPGDGGSNHNTLGITFTMLVISGYIVIILSVFGGFALAGGHLASLWQPVEILMIGGGAIGAFIVGNSSKAIRATLKALPSVLKGAKYSKAVYMELMTLLYDILGKIRKERVNVD